MKNMSITKKDVEHVARLARLALTEEEKERYTAQLSSILGYIEKLNELDTTDVPPTSHVFPVTNIWREDRAEPSTRETLGAPPEIIDNCPDHEGPFFKVKKVIE
jgi:aspartyl-tRNA(Asn)/glutamyl-tRNA(Gln) amidotransferase subunit C